MTLAAISPALVVCLAIGAAIVVFAALGAMASAIDHHARVADLGLEARRLRGRRGR